MMKVYQQLMGKIRRASHAMVQHIPEFLKKRTKNNAVVFVDEKRVLQYQKALDNDPLLYKAIDILMQERARDSRAEATTTLLF